MTVEGTATDHNAGYSRRPGGRWPSGLVATAAEDRLSFRRNPHTSFAAASDCRTIAIYEYTPLVREHVRERLAELRARRWEREPASGVSSLVRP